MKRTFSKRIVALLLALVMLCGLLPVTALAAGESSTPTSVLAAELSTEKTTYVLAGGDFQEGDYDANGDGTVTQHEASAQNVSKILEQITQHYSTMDGFLFTGDYDGDSHGENTQDIVDGMNSLMSTVQSYYSNLNAYNSVLVQGNHDPAATGFDSTGGQDFDGYSVYVIDEDDYPDRGGSQSGVQTVANNLKTWLAARENSSKPIFVITHLPLAYGTRTYQNGDGKYAKYIFDVLNAAGEKGQNIIFLHGHDHAYGCDNPLGGEAIYLPKGDTIRIADIGSTSQYQEYTLNFTYMNAGYVGYYNESGYTINERDDHKLTMTVFAITGDQVTVERYNAYGLYNMKSAGRDGYYSSTSSSASKIGLPINTTVYTSPQTIQLTQVRQAQTFTSTIGINVTTKSGTGLSVSELSHDTTYPNINRYRLYDISITDYEQGNEVSVTIPIPSDFDAGMTRVYRVNDDGTLENMRAVIKDGNAVFTTNHFSQYMLAEMNASALDWEEVTEVGGTVYKYELDTDGVDSGAHYLIVAPNDSVALADNGSGTGYSSVLSKNVIMNGNTATVDADTYRLADWTIAKNGTLTGPSVPVESYESSTVSSNVTSSGYYYLDGTAYYPVISATRASTTSQTATEATVTCNDLIRTNSPSWTSTGYYYKDGDNYYQIYAKRSSSGFIRTYTYTWGYSIFDDASNVIQIGTTQQTSSTRTTPDITVYRKPTDSTSYSWTIWYTKNGEPVTVSPAPTSQSITLYRSGTTTTSTHDAWTLKAQRGKYLKLGTGASGDFSYDDSASNIAIFSNTDNAGQYQLIRYYSATTNADLEYSGGWTTDQNSEGSANYSHTNPHYVRLYKYSRTETASGSTYYVAKDGANSFSFSTGSFANQAALEHYLRSVITVYRADDANGTNQTPVDYTISGNVNPTAEGSGTLTVSYGGKSWPITVSFASKAVTSVTVDKAGTVYVGAAAGTTTGSAITATFDDGTTETVPVTLAMVSGDYNIKKVGTYTGLTITYGGHEIDYTLNVLVNPNLDPFPKSPDEGSVTLNKTATGIDFKNTGVAQVELSARGIPYERGIDVIIMLDTSSSMWRNSTTLGAARYTVFAPAFRDLINDLQASESDIKVAIADFNGFNSYTTGTPATSYSRDMDTDRLADDVFYTAENSGVLYTGTNAGAVGTAANLNATAFVDVDTVDSGALYTTLTTSSTYKSGTNYDYAFWATYQLGASIKAYNEAENQDRDLVVVFMTDGAPMQYNGYHSNGASYTWGYWLDGTSNGSYTSYDEADYLQALTHVTGSEGGTLTTSDVSNANATDHQYYFGGIGAYAQLHRWNEAVKGSSGKNYEVIDKLQNTAAGENQYMISVPGLDATVYSIGFALDPDQKTETAHAERVVKQMATSDDYWFLATSAYELKSAFQRIKGDVFEAASNAYYDDQMGSEYDLQMAQFGDGNSPTIEVVTFDIYKRSDYEAGSIALDRVGTRKSVTGTVTERITFNDDGTQAFSTQIGNGTTNIFVDGLIVAKNFVYNTTNAAKTVTFNGQQVTVGAESFYWNLGTVKETEYALRYYVYLTGSMENERESGTYPTNDHATLHYENYAGATVSQDAPKPALAWEAAVVYYAAYLVNELGQPVNARGEVTGFADRIAIINPSEGDKVLFSETAIVRASVAASVIPQEYSLYDPEAEYSVTVNTQTQGGSWTITSGKTARTTYVTGFGSAGEYSNELTDIVPSHNYTATTVWFAVKYTIGTIKDDVVIDYGLPVDISVLSNDMFYESGTLVAVGPVHNNAGPEPALAAGFGKNLTTTYGTASVNGNYVRYQAKDMNMADYDRFSYAVNYQGNGSTSDENKGYFYGTVTVIPATSIYYEESFVSFEGDWTTVGTSNSNATQDEDRVGYTAITSIDANNVYGYDGAYSSYTTYSLGAAQKTTVNNDTNANPPTATFTFTGTAFDVISMTDSTTGTILVDVYQGTDASGTAIEHWVVDTYYGFARTQDATNPYLKRTWTYTDAWHVVTEEVSEPPANAMFTLPEPLVTSQTYVVYEPNYKWEPTENGDSIYQVPVLKSPTLAYGTYTVVISPKYAALFDHQNGGSYDFYFDAVRVYDPAGKPESGVVYDAYAADGELNPGYVEIRDLLIGADTFNAAVNGTQVSGVVFIDGAGSVASVSDYKNYGPKNEVYLESNQAIAFQMTSSIPDPNVQIGVKIANGSSAKMAVSSQRAGLNTTSSKGVTLTLNTATEMYYSLSALGVIWTKYNNEYVSSPIIISNTGSDGIVSLTNIKAPGASINAIQPAVTRSAFDMVMDALIPTAYAADDMGYDLKIFCTGALAEQAVKVLEDEMMSAYERQAKIRFDKPVLYPSLIAPTEKQWQNPYVDIASGTWYYEYVKAVTEKSLMQGSGNKFDPNGKLTRAMLVTVLYRMSGETSQAVELPFADVDLNSWYGDAAAWAFEKGVIKGVSATEFAPMQNVSRQDMAAMFARYAEAYGLNLKSADGTAFADDAQISDYAKDAVYSMKASGILSGRPGGLFDPKGTTTRAEAAKVLSLFAEMK